LVASFGSSKWWALGAVCLSVLAVSLDGTVLSVALPTLARALGAGESQLQWFSSGYLLTLAAAVLPAGLIGDRYGRKRVLLGSLALFGAGSIACAYAPSGPVFLVARLVLGVAGAGVTVMALSALTVLFDDAERPHAVGVYEAANFLALPLGPILGGWLLSRFWWGWVFLLNAPVVVLGLVVGIALVPESRTPRRPGLDPVGTALATIGLVVLTYGLIDAGRRGWGGAAPYLVAGLVLLAGFMRWERGAREPLVDPALFGYRPFAWGTVLSGLAGLGMIGLLFVLPQYFQAVRGLDAFGAGLRLLPFVGGLVAGALPAGRLVRAAGPAATVATGFAVLAAGSALGATAGAQAGTAFIATWTALTCAGAGLALTAATATALAPLSAERSGTGSAVVQAVQKTSAPVGTAIMGSVLAAQLGSAGPGPDTAAAFVRGMDHALLVSATIAVVGGILALATLRPTREAVHA
jgi:EmrB/QacA subfamily drug resistance transporter